MKFSTFLQLSDLGLDKLLEEDINGLIDQLESKKRVRKGNLELGRNQLQKINLKFNDLLNNVEILKNQISLENSKFYDIIWGSDHNFQGSSFFGCLDEYNKRAQQKKQIRDLNSINKIVKSIERKNIQELTNMDKFKHGRYNLEPQENIFADRFTTLQKKGFIEPRFPVVSRRNHAENNIVSRMASEFMKDTYPSSQLSENHAQMILCCECGVTISPNLSTMCINCIKVNIDITDGISKENIIHSCRECGRFLQSQNQWLYAQVESKELLSFCLKKTRGLNKVRLVDAFFLWTEPHSRKIKIKVTIQKEVLVSTILQQTFEVEYTVMYQQCSDCARIYTAHTWKALVQIRQKVDHKKTFLYLEQLILRHHAHRDASNIKEVKDGLDFYYLNRNHAIKFVEFLSTVVPVKTKKSEELISTDIKSNISNYKFVYSVELIPICKDDLVCLPKDMAKSMGNLEQLVLCYKVGNSIHVIDPRSLQIGNIVSAIYWKMPFFSLCDVKDLVEFIVLDVELLGPVTCKFALAEIQVMRSFDLGSNNNSYFVYSHLGSILKTGDTVMGYYLENSNFNNSIFEAYQETHAYVPEVVLVKKAYLSRRKKSRIRNWKLKSLFAKERSEINGKKCDKKCFEDDYERFLQDLEEDVELRQNVNLYKTKTSSQKILITTNTEDGIEDSDGFPEIDVSELIDEIEEMNISEEI
ncbi:hypothetical protein PMAC_000486 [Pneumocystis sp. 'macacae']|nr:hypothetical protein PMAC_000486 [Pneumocystis sp. 'macacae']